MVGQLVNFFPARAIALSCLYVEVQERTLNLMGDVRLWLQDVSSRKVHWEDFEEICQILLQADRRSTSTIATA